MRRRLRVGGGRAAPALELTVAATSSRPIHQPRDREPRRACTRGFALPLPPCLAREHKYSPPMWTASSARVCLAPALGALAGPCLPQHADRFEEASGAARHSFVQCAARAPWTAQLGRTPFESLALLARACSLEGQQGYAPPGSRHL